MTTTERTDEIIRVKAPIDDPDIPIWTEVMAAATDPGHSDQAVLLNVPCLIDGINFGDIVRLGPADEFGVRPIVRVVLASGHVRIAAATEPGEAADLAAELERTFPAYALRIEGHSQQLLSISIHPDLDPEKVSETVEAWLAAGSDDESLAISPIIETEIGPVRWPRFEPS